MQHTDETLERNQKQLAEMESLMQKAQQLREAHGQLLADHGVPPEADLDEVISQTLTPEERSLYQNTVKSRLAEIETEDRAIEEQIRTETMTAKVRKPKTTAYI